MPELPEVEVVTRGLNKFLTGKIFSNVVIHNPSSFPNDPQIVQSFLIGGRILSVRRRAKMIIIDVDSSYALVIHLKMTGQLVYRAQDQDQNWGGGHPNNSLIGELPDKSTRVEMLFDDGSKLFFNDQRKFGWVKLFPDAEVANIKFMQTLGPEPLEMSFTPKVFIQRVRTRARTNIKAVILDQTVLAGVGNIYADESLFLAGIHTTRLVMNLTDKELTKLHIMILSVLQTSIDKGGSSSRNYVDATGAKGNYLDNAYVYGRTGLACRVCDSPIEKIRVAGRGTHFCINCQPLEGS